MSNATETDIRLIKEAQAERERMIRNKSTCCINCKFARALLDQDRIHKDCRTHYVRCTWIRIQLKNWIKEGKEFAASLSCINKYLEPTNDPLQNQMSGQKCKTFVLREENPTNKKSGNLT